MNKLFGNRADEQTFGKLSARTRATLLALLQSPTADKATAEAEAVLLAERQALKAGLDALDKAPPRTDLEAAIRSAVAEINKLKTALQDAEQRLPGLRAAAEAVEARARQERFDLVKRLHASADPRLSDFLYQLRDLVDSALPMALELWIDPALTERGAYPLRSTAAECGAAREALGAAVEEVEALRLQPLSYVDVSQQLMGLCQRLAPALAKVQLNPPSLVAATCEVGPALRWSGISTWVVDEERRVSPQEAAAERQAALQAGDVANRAAERMAEPTKRRGLFRG